MNSRDRFLLVPLAGLLAMSLILGGCDQAAEQRKKTQIKITDAGENIEKATMVALDPSDPGFGIAQESLRKVVTEMQGISGAEAGQMAAKHMLAATALRELALMSLTQIEEIEVRHQHQRAIILSKIQAARELEAAAEALEQIEVQSEQRQLQQVRSIAQTAMAQASQQLAGLDGPIAERAAQNARDTQEATRLNEQAGLLRRQSAETGYAAGFPAYERAVALERQADRIEYEISQRRIELDFQLEPEHALAQARADQMNALLKAVEASEGDLDELAQLTADTAAATRRTIGELRQTIAEDLNQLAEETTGTLDGLYAKAGKDLTNAASLAGNAAREAQKTAGGPRSEDGNDAKVLQARINGLQGGMYWDVARVAAERGIMLAHLLEAGDLLGDPQALASLLEAANREYEETLAGATTAYQSAQSALATVKGSGGQREVEAFKLGVDTALAALTGSTAPSLAPSPETSEGPERNDGSTDADSEATAGEANQTMEMGEPEGGFDDPDK